VCEHPEHDAINHALAAGVSYRQIESQFPDVSRSTLSRHTSHRSETPPTEDPAVVSLCPARDPDADTTRRQQLVDALDAAKRQLATITDALDVHAVELAKVIALEAVRGFQPWRVDDDLRPLPEYQQWMGRPREVKETTERLLTTWRQALQGLQKAQWGLAAHDRRVQQYEHERAFLDTPNGTALEQEYGAIHDALRAAEQSGNARLVSVYRADAERLQQRFLAAVQSTRRAA
jgi:hypothetical protein